MTDNRNMFIAIGLSLVILIGWQYFIALPQAEKQRQIQAQQQAAQATQTPSPSAEAAQGGGAAPTAPGSTGVAGSRVMTRAQALAATPRVAIETPSLRGSISLRGARADDLTLSQFRETVDPRARTSCSCPLRFARALLCGVRLDGGPGANLPVPGPDTLWTAEAGAKLTPAPRWC